MLWKTKITEKNQRELRCGKRALPKISTRITVRKRSITGRRDEHYGGRHAHYKKESTFSITVGTEHSAGKGCSPCVQMGLRGEGNKKSGSLTPKGRPFFIKKKELCIPSERCVEPGSHG
jgi:hypothetical protein